MRLIVLVCSFQLTWGSVEPQLPGPIPAPFELIYGSDPKQVSAPVRREQQSKTLPKEYYELRQPDNCVFPIDIVLLLDATASTSDNIDRIADTTVPELVTMLSQNHPYSRLGVVSFKDKPIPTLGRTYDYCYRLEMPLSQNTEGIQKSIHGIVPGGGIDPAENQFGALIATMQDEAIGWNDMATKVVAVVTDSWPHYADDGLNHYGLAAFDPAQTPEAQCTSSYYPSPQQVQQIAESSNTYLVFLVYDGAYANNLPYRSWDWFNKLLDQPAEFLSDVHFDGSNFWEKFSTALKRVEVAECDASTTTSSSEPQPTTTSSNIFQSTTTKGKLRQPTVTGLPNI